MKLHLLGIFYSIHDPAYSHCPFTDKCIRFPKMMQAQGFEVVEYANEGSRSQAREKVIVLDQVQFKRLKELHKQEFPNDPANVSSTLCKTFEEKLIKELLERAEPYDIICHPFGMTHARLGEVLPKCFHVETGVGYLGTHFAHKIYESYAWWHYHQGRENRAGTNYEWVIPMSYDLEDWEPCHEPGEYILYFGRITADKGLAYVTEIARHTNREVILCGSGDPSPYLGPAVKNLRAIPPISGRARSDLLRKAYCMLMPTLYTEPFGSAGVEGMLCGTPLIASDFGAFSETVWHEVTGFRCKTLGDWVDAVNRAGSLDRRFIAEHTRKKHSLEACGPLYAKVFQQILDLRDKGWYSLTPIMAIPPRGDTAPAPHSLPEADVNPGQSQANTEARSAVREGMATELLCLKLQYHLACAQPSDINEHLPTLHALAKECRHVTEMGTRSGVSTTALLYAQPEVLICYDRVKLPEVDRLQSMTGRTDFLFHQKDVLHVEIEPTDLLFIDTWHVYEQLAEELRLHSGKVRKYVVLHDTTTFGEVGEDPSHRGLWPAVEELLTQGQFVLKARFENNNGLTILERVVAEHRPSGIIIPSTSAN